MNRHTMNSFVAVVCAAATLLPLAHAQNAGAGRKPQYKSQSAVAARGTTFGTIAATDVKVKTALDAKALDKAKAKIGEQGAFTGKVVKVFAPPSNMIVILNFDKNYRDALTAVVKGSSFAKFPDLNMLKDKKVLISGEFIEYEGRVEIELTSPDQIKIVK